MRSTILGRRKTSVLLLLPQQDFPSDSVDFIVLLRLQELETSLVMLTTVTSEFLALVRYTFCLSSPLRVTLLNSEATQPSAEQEIGLVLATCLPYLEPLKQLHSYLLRTIEHSSTLRVNSLRSLVRVTTMELDNSSDSIVPPSPSSLVLLLVVSSQYMVKSLTRQSSTKLDLDLLVTSMVVQRELPSTTTANLPSAYVKVKIMDLLLNLHSTSAHQLPLEFMLMMLLAHMQMRKHLHSEQSSMQLIMDM